MIRKVFPYIIAFALIVAALCTTGCRSSRSSAGSKMSASGSPRERMEALAASYASTPLGSVSVPVTVEITSAARAKISGNLYIASSQYIYFSARFLGIEVGTVMITPDSIYGKIKPGKMYLAEPVSALTSVLPVTLDQIQGLIMGRIAIPGYAQIDKEAIKNCRFNQATEEWSVTPTRLPSSFDMTYVMSSSDNTISQLIARVKGRADVTMDMSDYSVTAIGNVPKYLSIDAMVGEKSLGVNLEYNLSRLRSDVAIDKSWSVPRGYTRVSASQVIKALSNL